jgi:DNA-directed RNA polymerase subunit RPC12/RpoP/predicted SprT family Zn-dependent metalloprotease
VSIAFRCGRCVHLVTAGDAEANRVVRCPHCGHANLCPAGRASATPARGPISTIAPVPRPTPGLSARAVWVALGVLALLIAGWPMYSACPAPSARATTSRLATSPEALQDALLRANLGRPGDPELTALYEDLNSRHFARLLPALPVVWEPRLDEVGAAAGHAFTLKGMFGHVGTRAIILLNPTFKNDRREIERALSHEAAHAYLFATGEDPSGHGPAFQTVLRRLADEGAFQGVPSTRKDRERLRAWIDAEAIRLDAEPERDRIDVEHFNKEVARYNLMLLYPDGLGDGSRPGSDTGQTRV